MREHAQLLAIALAMALGGTVLIGTALPAPVAAQDEADETSDTPQADAAEEADPVPETSSAEPDEEPTPETSSAPTDPSAEPEAGTDGSDASTLDAPSTDAEESADDAGASEEGEEEEPAHHGPQFTFSNSFFSWTGGVTVNTFAPGAQLSYDPTFMNYFYFNPRFYLTDTTFLWLSAGLMVEATDTNTYSYNREPLLMDTYLDLRQLVHWEGFVFMGQARLGFPTSKSSIAARQIMQTGLGVTVTRPFPELASFTVSATFRYSRNWSTGNVTQTTDGVVYPSCQSFEGSLPAFCTQAGDGTNTRDSLLTGLTLTVMPYTGLTVSLSGFYLAGYGYEVATAAVPINGGTTTLSDTSPTHWRGYTYFSLAVAYDVLPWLNLQLGIQNAGNVAPVFNPDGSVRSPFNPDTQVFLSTTLSLDGIYDQIFGVHGEEEDLTPQERQRRRQGLAMRGSATTF